MKKFILTVVSIVILFVFHGCSPVSVFPVGGSVASSLANVVGGSGFGLSVLVTDSAGNQIMDDNLFVQVFEGEVMRFFDYDNPVSLVFPEGVYLVRVGFPLDSGSVQTRVVELTQNVNLIIGLPLQIPFK